jgi:hypothetical protein
MAEVRLNWAVGIIDHSSSSAWSRTLLEANVALAVVTINARLAATHQEAAIASFVALSWAISEVCVAPPALQGTNVAQVLSTERLVGEELRLRRQRCCRQEYDEGHVSNEPRCHLHWTSPFRKQLLTTSSRRRFKSPRT